MKTTVLDASALLALFFDEPGAEKVEHLLHQAAEADEPLLIAAVNWAEVLEMMERKNGAQGWSRALELSPTASAGSSSGGMLQMDPVKLLLAQRTVQGGSPPSTVSIPGSHFSWVVVSGTAAQRIAGCRKATVPIGCRRLEATSGATTFSIVRCVAQAGVCFACGNMSWLERISHGL